MVSQVFSGGLSGSASSADSAGTGGRMPPASDVPIFDGSPEEMLSAEYSDEELQDLMEGDTKSPLEGMAEMVMGDIFEGQVGPQTAWEHMQAFRAAINWTAADCRTACVPAGHVCVDRGGHSAGQYGITIWAVGAHRCYDPIGRTDQCLRRQEVGGHRHAELLRHERGVRADIPGGAVAVGLRHYAGEFPEGGQFVAGGGKDDGD